MTNLTHTDLTDRVKIPANHAVTKRLGNWTTERQFQVRAHRGSVVLDLRSPQIPDGDIEIDADLDHAMVKLLVPDGAQVDDWDLKRTGRGRIKDAERPDGSSGRRIVDHWPDAAQRDPGSPRRYRRSVGHVLQGVPRRPAAGPPREPDAHGGRPGPHQLAPGSAQTARAARVARHAPWRIRWRTNGRSATRSRLPSCPT